MFRSLLLASVLIFPALSQAQDAHFLRHTSSSCSARSIDEYYCPVFGSDWRGPYFDNGCSVKCKAGQSAQCREAHCDDNQDGQPVDSKCLCK